MPERSDANAPAEEAAPAVNRNPQWAQGIIHEISDTMERALDACHRLGKFYESVVVNERDRGMWLLDVMRGLETDDKPQLPDPLAVWEKVRSNIGPAGSGYPPLPPANEWSGPTPNSSEIRRKPMHTATQAALFAPARLLEDLFDRCQDEAVAAPDAERHNEPSSSLLNWKDIRSLLGNFRGHHFHALAEYVRDEAARAIDRVEIRANSSLGELPPEQGGGNPPNGPEAGTRKFWYHGQRHTMPRGNVTDLVTLLWNCRNQRTSEGEVTEKIWDQKGKTRGDTALSSLRRHCNRFFADKNLPFAISIQSSPDSVVRIIDRSDNILPSE